jgi:rhodanese-related sulfurtransferase
MKEYSIIVGSILLFVVIMGIMSFRSSKNEVDIKNMYTGSQRNTENFGKTDPTEMSKNFSQIDVSEFKKALQDQETILIDVRTPEELPLYGKIRENQELINLNGDDFASKIEILDPSKNYLVYCWHGNRSQIARDFMRDKGFVQVRDLKGGIDAWEKSGEEIVK